MTFSPRRYERQEPAEKVVDATFQARKSKFLLYNVIIPYALIFLGVTALVTIVIIPLFLFSPTSSLAAVSPVAEIFLIDKITGFAPFEFSEFEDEYQVNIIPVEKGPIPQKFYLTVPKLGIERAVVDTNSADLDPDDSLGHYQGTALPGELGNSFIYGHSVLPAFFRPTD